MPRLMPEPGPQRVLAASNFVYTVGSGLYLTAGVLYFTEAVHLPADEVGLGLGLAGLVALALGISVGHLADRRGARGVYAATLVVQALATAGFVLANSFWPFVLAVTAAMRREGCRDSSTQPAHPALRRRPAPRVPRLPPRRDERRHLPRRGGRGMGRSGGNPHRLSAHGHRQRDRLRGLRRTPGLPAAGRPCPDQRRPPLDRPQRPPLPADHRTRRHHGHPVQGPHRGYPALAGQRHHRPALAHLRHHADRHRHSRRFPGAGQPQHRLARSRMETPTAGPTLLFSSPAR